MELLRTAPDEHPDALASRVKLARALGHHDLVICHTKHDKQNTRIPGTKNALLVTTTNQAKTHQRHYDLIIAPAKREFFESRHVNAILEPENHARPDFLHHRNSGLNQVLLKLCQPTTKRPGKAIITTTTLLLDARHPPAVVLGRMRQNARWCKKYGVPYHVTSGARTPWEQRDKACLEALQRLLEKR